LIEAHLNGEMKRLSIEFLYLQTIVVFAGPVVSEILLSGPALED
jgi:hypothetical protein